MNFRSERIRYCRSGSTLIRQHVSVGVAGIVLPGDQAALDVVHGAVRLDLQNPDVLFELLGSEIPLPQICMWSALDPTPLLEGPIDEVLVVADQRDVGGAATLDCLDRGI